MTPGKWLHQLLDIMIDKQASDMLLSTNAPPSLKISSKLVALGDTALSVDQVRELVLAALPEGARERFEARRNILSSWYIEKYS